MEMNFCERWFRQKKMIIGPMNIEKAKKLDQKGKPYTVIIGSSENPEFFIEVNKGFYGVSFLDDLKREYLLYNFEEITEGMLFLKEAIHREFDGKKDPVISGTVYRFSPDGTVKIEKSKAPFEKAEMFEKKTDVSKNWEKKPEFGKYENLIKKER